MDTTSSRLSSAYEQEGHSMSIKDYRSQLEQQVAQESSRAAAESVPESLGAPAGDATALGRLVRQEDPSTAHVAPLQRLADPDEKPSVRLAALGLLKLL